MPLCRNVLIRKAVSDMVLRGVPVSADAVHSASRGLIGDISFGVLPEIKPIHCFTMTLAFNIVRLAMSRAGHAADRFAV